MEKVTTFNLLVMLLLVQTRVQLAFFAARAHHRFIFNLAFNRLPWVFFEKLLSSQSTPSMYWGIVSDAGLLISLCFTSWGSCQSISPACWMATQACGTQTTCPSFVSSAALLRVHSVLIHVTNEDLIQHWSHFQPLEYPTIDWPPVGLLEAGHRPLNSTVP